MMEPRRGARRLLRVSRDARYAASLPVAHFEVIVAITLVEVLHRQAIGSRGLEGREHRCIQ